MLLFIEGRLDCERAGHAARKYTKSKGEDNDSLCVGIIVHGQKADGVAFSERTKTGVVSPHGALILLREPVSAGQNLTLRNILTSEEVTCAVAESNPGQAGVAEVGVQFVHPSPRFWRVAIPPVAIPPSDWSSRSPEAKRFNTQTQIHPKPANKK
jgi:hypothetical protein